MIQNNDIYSLTSGKYNGYAYVENSFFNKLVALSGESAKQLKVLTLVENNKISKRGDTIDTSKTLQEKAVIDVKKLSPLLGLGGAKNIGDEVAYYRWKMLNFTDESLADWVKYKDLLFIDYLLAGSLCYVEVFKKEGTVDKFYATKNRLLAGAIAGVSESDTLKYRDFLNPLSVDYKVGKLRVLKMSSNKKGWKITQPRNTIDFKGEIKITPLFLTLSFLKGIGEVLNNNIVKFTFVKDNKQERELVSTLSLDILKQYYDENRAKMLKEGVERKLERGYIKLPELGLSKYDDSGMRALNINRIVRMELLKEVDRHFIDVDLKAVVPTFINRIRNVKDINVLNVIMESLTGDSIKSLNPVDVQNTLISVVESSVAIGTTTYLKMLHRHMLMYPMVYTNYTGKPVMQTSKSFDLGVGY